VEKLCQEIKYQPMFLPLYYSLRKEWSNMKRDQVHARVKKSKIDDFQNKDRGTKGFFQRLAQNRKRASITAISNAQGQLFTNKEAILRETQRYFQSLYQNQTTQPEAQTTFLQLINQRLDPADNKKSMQTIPFYNKLKFSQ